MATPANSERERLEEVGLLDPERPLSLAGQSPLVAPPNDGRVPLNPYLTFASVVNAGGSRTWRVLFDDALQGGRMDWQAMRKDPVIKTAIDDRRYPTVQLETSLEPVDESDPKQADAAEILTHILDGIPHFQGLKWWLLEDLYFGKSATQLQFDGWQTKFKGKNYLGVKKWFPLNGDKLTQKWGGQWECLVHGSEYRGYKEPTDFFTAHPITASERECFVVSQFQREDADFLTSQLGGLQMGAGYRHYLYYVWKQKVALQAVTMDFAQLMATGFIIYYYEAGNPTSLSEVKEAALQQIGNNAILFPRYGHGNNGNLGPGVQRVEPGTAGVNLLINLFTQYYDNIIRGMISGAGMSGESERLNMGGDEAGAMSTAVSRVVKFDAHRLEWCLHQDLVRVLCKYNFGKYFPCPRLRFSVEKPDAEKILQAAQVLFQMGAALDLGYLLEVVGIPPAEPNKPVLSMAGPQQPSAVTDVPTGQPMATPAGPAGPQGQNGQQGMMAVPTGQGQAQQYVRRYRGVKYRPLAASLSNLDTKRRLSRDEMAPSEQAAVQQLLDQLLSKVRGRGGRNGSVLANGHGGRR